MSIGTQGLHLRFHLLHLNLKSTWVSSEEGPGALLDYFIVGIENRPRRASQLARRYCFHPVNRTRRVRVRAVVQKGCVSSPKHGTPWVQESER